MTTQSLARATAYAPSSDSPGNSFINTLHAVLTACVGVLFGLASATLTAFHAAPSSSDLASALVSDEGVRAEAVADIAAVADDAIPFGLSGDRIEDVVARSLDSAVGQSLLHSVVAARVDYELGRGPAVARVDLAAIDLDVPGLSMLSSAIKLEVEVPVTTGGQPLTGRVQVAAFGFLVLWAALAFARMTTFGHSIVPIGCGLLLFAVGVAVAPFPPGSPLPLVLTSSTTTVLLAGAVVVLLGSVSQWVIKSQRGDSPGTQR